jgi:(E)-4-hydroxy-3-methylbut-2-enyl-diphosphate synthase
MPPVTRRATVTAWIGDVPVGSCHPIVVQSMTNTDTADVDATVEQVAALAQAGSELVRVTVNNEPAAQAVPEIVARLADRDVTVPIIGDFHYNGHLLLPKYAEMAAALAKYRINPGNVGAKRRDEHFKTILEVALAHAKPVRIGVNWGSLDQNLLTELMDENAEQAEPLDAREVTLNAMVESAMRSAAFAEETGLAHDRIILSVKMSQVQDLVDVYRKLAPLSDYPLHLGLWAPRGSWGARLGSRCCCSRGSATRSASPSRPPPAGIAPRRCVSPSRSFRPWSSGAFCRRSPPARAAVAPRARSSRRWPTRSRRTCASRCPSGRLGTPAWRKCGWL